MREAFQTTGAAGLDHDTLPMRLYHKAKQLGVWDPRELDLSRDAQDWAGMSEPQRLAVLSATSLFQAGEEGVTLDLLPLVLTIASEGRLEEQLFLTTFLWEEGKHVEFFRRVLDEVCRVEGDLHGFHTPNYRTIFYDELPRAMARLLTDRSPEAQVRAVVTYNMIVEGVLAETGYHGYFLSLERNDLLPGLRAGLRLVKRDESRHIAYGVFLLSRLIADNAELGELARAEMERLLVPAIAFVEETFEPLGGVNPFGVTLDELVAFARDQFRKRLDRVERGAKALSAVQLASVAEEEVPTGA